MSRALPIVSALIPVLSDRKKTGMVPLSAASLPIVTTALLAEILSSVRFPVPSGAAPASLRRSRQLPGHPGGVRLQR